MGQVFRLSLAAILATFLIGLFLPNTPAWLSGLLTIAVLSAVVSGVVLLARRSSRRVRR